MKKILTVYGIPIIAIIMSIIFGIATNDILIGTLILATSLLCAWFAAKGNRANYIIGFINYLLMAYASFNNHLNGLFMFYTFVFAPLQIYGYFQWKKNSDDDNKITVKRFTPKKAAFVFTISIIGSLFLGYLLSHVPDQRLSFMDAASNCFNLCGVILMIRRYRESWVLWLVNNIIDLVIWIITFVTHGPNSAMMLLASISYLLLNIYGIVMWNIKSKDKHKIAGHKNK